MNDPITSADTELLSLAEAKQRHTGPLVSVVLEWLSIMEQVVNRPKQPAITRADWAPLGRLLDPAKFRRVGNFGVRNDWDSYQDLLVLWANGSWWAGYIGRVREVPASDGRPALVYMETEERSRTDRPVADDGDYKTLGSIAVYAFDENRKVTRIDVYDQRPL
jgi:hypothetical protein